MVASVLFTLALNYKQMSLYHALPFFAVLLGRIVQEPTNRARAVHLLAVGGAVVTTCLCLWGPWLSREGLAQMAHRIFPVARGLYEDKVGNVWCSVSPFIKLKELYDTAFLTRLCLATTLASCLPKMLECLRKPTPAVFMLTLFNNALAFYLFSYHVHEVCKRHVARSTDFSLAHPYITPHKQKSILLPALPASALAGEYPVPVFVFSFYACFR